MKKKNKLQRGVKHYIEANKGCFEDDLYLYWPR